MTREKMWLWLEVLLGREAEVWLRLETWLGLGLEDS